MDNVQIFRGFLFVEIILAAFSGYLLFSAGGIFLEDVSLLALIVLGTYILILFFLASIVYLKKEFELIRKNNLCIGLISAGVGLIVLAVIGGGIFLPIFLFAISWILLLAILLAFILLRRNERKIISSKIKK